MSQGKQPDTESTDAAFSSDVSGVTLLSALVCWHTHLQLFAGLLVHVGSQLDVFIWDCFARTAVTKVKDEASLGGTVDKTGRNRRC